MGIHFLAGLWISLLVFTIASAKAKARILPSFSWFTHDYFCNYSLWMIDVWKMKISEILKLALFGIFLIRYGNWVSRPEQVENWSWLVKFWKPFVNLFPPSDGRGNFGAFSTCSGRETQFPYRTRKIPNSANKAWFILNFRNSIIPKDFQIELYHWLHCPEMSLSEKVCEIQLVRQGTH